MISAICDCGLCYIYLKLLFRILLVLKLVYSGSGIVKSAKGTGWTIPASAKAGGTATGSAVWAVFNSVDAISGKAISVGAISVEAISVEATWLEANGSMPGSLEVRRLGRCL